LIVCIAANPSVDRLVRVDRLRPGAIHRPLDLVAVAGGKGLNVARAAARLGGDVRAVALLAGHTGRFIADELRREGVPFDAVWFEGETRTCTSVAADDGTLTEFYEYGGDVPPGNWAEFVAAAQSAAAEASWTTISGSLPAGAPPDGYLSVMAGAHVALDSREHGVDASPSLIKVNAAEAEELTGSSEPARAAELLVAAGAELAIVTLGAEGAVAFDGERLHTVTLDAHGPYPVGSGDSFLAGLVVAFDAGAELSDALRLAAGAAAANAEMAGAAIFERTRAEALALRATVEAP
jgi:1-phosphofructokinase family hexose kinase